MQSDGVQVVLQADIGERREGANLIRLIVRLRHRGDARGGLGAERQVVATNHHVERRRYGRLAVGRQQQVLGREHDLARFGHRLVAERDVDGHLVAVEVGVEGRADERVDLNRRAVDEDGLERLDAKAVQGRRAVEQYRSLLDHALQHFPDILMAAFDHALG